MHKNRNIEKQTFKNTSAFLVLRRMFMPTRGNHIRLMSTIKWTVHGYKSVRNLLVFTTNVHTHKGQSHSPNVWDKPDATWLQKRSYVISSTTGHRTPCSRWLRLTFRARLFGPHKVNPTRFALFFVFYIFLILSRF